MITEMKVTLQKENKWRSMWRAPESSTIEIKSSLPYFHSPAASRSHRVRSGRYHLWEGKITHAAFTLWCGQTGYIAQDKRGRLSSEPVDWLPVCGTCEGRAIGAGQTESRKIAGRVVVFTPRTDFHQVEEEKQAM